MTGTSEPGASVVVTMGAVSHTVTTQSDGTWSVDFATNEIPTGTYDTTVTAVSTDAAGNVETTTSNVRVDTEIAVALDPTQAGDNIINAAEVAAGVNLTGTAEPGATVQVTMQGVTKTVTAAANGGWSATFSSTEIPAGEYDAPVSVTSSDLAGNTSTATGTVRVDTQTNVGINPNQAGGDDIVNAAEAAAGVTFTGTAEANSTVVVTVAGVSRTVSTGPTGAWSAVYGANTIPQGEYDTTISVTSTDAAGNTATDSRSMKVDTTPGTVALSRLPIEIDDVINAVERSDGVIINGTATPGLTVTVTLGNATAQVVASANGSWSVNIPANEVPTGTQTLPIAATITDAAGNTASVSDSVLLDTVVDNFAMNNQGAVEGDNTINALERADGVSLNGTVEPGSTVTVQLGSATQNATVDGAGNWTVNFPAGSIPTGTYDADIVVSATDRAGNTEVVRDSVHVDTELSATSDPNQSADDVINAAERMNGVNLTGTADPGSTVVVQLQGVTRNATVDANGNWTAAFTPNELPEGTYTATATITATDAAGNVTTLSESFGVDTEIATAGVDSVTYIRSDVGRIGTQDSIDDYSVNTLESNGTVGTPAATQTTHPVFGTEFTFQTPIPDGTNLVVSRTDSAGNTSGELVILEDNATNAGTIDHAGLAGFDIQSLNLDYGNDTNLTLTEAQIRAMSGSTDTLAIQGGTDDQVTVAGASNTGQTQQIDGQTYNVYTIGNDGTTLLIDQDVTVII